MYCFKRIETTTTTAITITNQTIITENNTPQPSMAYPVTMEPYSTYAFPVMLDQRFNASREPSRPDPMTSPFSTQMPPSNTSAFPPPYLSQKGPLQDVDRSTSDIFANKRNQLRAEFLARSNTTDPGSSEPNTSDRPDSANTNSSNPESGNDLEDDEDELTGKRRPILKTNEDRRVHHKLVEQERRKTMNKYINRLRELMDIPAPTKGRGLKKSIVLEKACEYVDKIHDYVATLYNANQQLTSALNMRGVTPQMMAQLNIPFVPPPPSHIYPPSNYRAPQYINSSPMNQRVDPHSNRVPMMPPYPPYFKPEMHGQHIDQPFPAHLENPLNINSNTPNPFNTNMNAQQQPNPNNFNSNAHSSFSEKHTEP
jgi:hypothetical protein